MAIKEKLTKVLLKKIDSYDGYLDSAKEINNQVEDVQERKRETEAKLLFVYNAPEEYLEENLPLILPVEEDDAMRLGSSLLGLRSANRKMMLSISDTSGSSAVYSSWTQQVASISPSQRIRMIPVSNLFESLAIDKARREEFPEKLNKINHQLGDMFLEANKNVEIARAEIMKANKAMADMSDVTNQLWAGLAELSFKKTPQAWRGIQHKQLKKESHRNIVADSLSDDDNKKKKWILLLGEMSILYQELSQTNMSKNPLNSDTITLNEFYSRWIMQISDAIILVS